MYCINCGNKVNSTDNFCNKCGNNVSTNQNLNTQPKENKSTNVSLVLGIIACCLFFIPFISIPLAILAIVLGIINRKEHKLTGLILGIISIILVIIEVIALILFTGFLTREIIDGDFLEEIREIIEENTEFEINGNKFIVSDNSIIEFNLDGTYYWTIDNLNYNQGSYTTYSKINAYNYAKNNLKGFNVYNYDVDDFYLIVMIPTEIMMNGSIIKETNTVYYYGEYEKDERTLELYNHNTGNILKLTLYNNSKPNNIDI